MTTVIYCDESCHLQHDDSSVMGIGCVWLDKKDSRQLSLELRDIKRRHRAAGELKWTKVSHSKSAFYAELTDWFFRQSGVNFRCIVVPDKTKLNHEKYNKGSHDDFYYKMYFSMLNKVLSPDRTHHIYIDIKDTRSNMKVQHLSKVLGHNVYDFTGEMVQRIQQVRSHEVELLQLCDFLLGAVVYANRGLEGNPVKMMVADKLREQHGAELMLLPPEIDCNGIWEDVRDRLYNEFCQIFLTNPCPVVEGRVLTIDGRKIDDNFEEGFWHVTTRGPKGKRQLDYERARRLRWIKPMLDGTAPGLTRWRHTNAEGVIRQYYWLEEEKYVLVLEETKRTPVLALVTAFYVNRTYMTEELTKKRNEGAPF